MAGSLAIAAGSPPRVHRQGLAVRAGELWRKGTWLTALLWIVSLAAHLGYDYVVTAKGVGDATILLYLAVRSPCALGLLYRVHRNPPPDLIHPPRPRRAAVDEAGVAWTSVAPARMRCHASVGGLDAADRDQHQPVADARAQRAAAPRARAA